MHVCRTRQTHVGFVVTIAVLVCSDLLAGVRILASPESDSAVKVAASEFRKYWREICGEELFVDREDDGVSDYVKISCHGKGPAIGSVYDEYRIQSVDDAGRHHLVLAGCNGRSVIYAVYDFLQRRGGCRWFWDGDVVPKGPAPGLGGLDVCEKSAFEYRGTHYFAHRGLTRFQALHWGPEDWKREIDYCLKLRLNFFMLQIGYDDFFQKAFPDVVPYPDPAVTQPKEVPDQEGYDNHSPHWPLEYRGRLRKFIMDYAYERGLIHPCEFGTLTHWFSRTPQAFLEKMKPEFLPQATSNYSEPSGRIWDIRRQKWFDAYWRLTDAQLENYVRDDVLFTPGFDERTVFKDREANLAFKKEQLKRFLDYAHAKHPKSRLIIEGWDFQSSWRADEVRELIPTLDPETTIIWDYEADARRNYTCCEEPGSNFTEWGVVGRFPYAFGILLGLHRASDIRADYETIRKRQRVVDGDSFCKAYLLWPETSHSDIFAWRHFAVNSWRISQRSLDDILAEFCRDRYGAASKEYEHIWKRVIPLSRLVNWWDCYPNEVTSELRKTWNDAERARSSIFPSVLEAAPEIFRRLATVSRTDDFMRRDSTDLARTTADRFIYAMGRDLAKTYHRIAEGKATVASLERKANLYVEAGRLAGRILASHGDFSLADSLRRLSTIEPVRNPDFEHVLAENSSCWYCRSHQAEYACGWYVREMEDIARELVEKAKATGGSGRLSESGRDYMSEILKMDHPILSQIPDCPRTDAFFRDTARAFADVADAYLITMQKAGGFSAQSGGR